MLADTGDGPGASNGTSKATVSNGTRVSQRIPLSPASNGAHKPASDGLNGSSQHGKAPACPPQPSTYMTHDREEMTRLLIQALSEMGYREAAEIVSKDSGIELESPTVASFRAAVLGGRWTQAEKLLDGALMAGVDQQQHGNGLVLSPSADKVQMRFWLKQQKYLELLEQQESARALLVLRTELASLCQEKTLHFLASLLMCQSPDDLKLKAKWDGARGQSRHALLSALSQNVSASVMLPEHRLADLLQQVKSHQTSGCMYHTNPEPPSLYADHFCPPGLFPNEVCHEMDTAPGEVWQVAFSYDGSRLASCGKDKYVTIWEVPTFGVLQKLDAVDNFNSNLETSGVCSVAWSQDDSCLVTCGRDGITKMWDVNDGSLKWALEAHSEPVTSCVWAPDGQSIILGSLDKAMGLTQWRLADGERIYTWSQEHRVEDMAISPDGQWLVGMVYENSLLFYNYMTRELERELELKARPTSITISQDSSSLLINKDDGEAKLIHIQGAEPAVKYTGGTGGLYMIRSAFGGANESYVISGSEDGNVLIWHKWSGLQVRCLQAHKPRANAVSWNPANTCMFASCGDDGKIKIWSNRETARRLAPGTMTARSSGVNLAAGNANGNGASSRASNGAADL